MPYNFRRVAPRTSYVKPAANDTVLQISYALDRCLTFWCLTNGGDMQGEEQQGKYQQQQKWLKSKAFCGSMPCLGGFPYHACISHSGRVQLWQNGAANLI